MLELGILAVVAVALVVAFVAYQQKSAAEKRESDVRESLGIIVPNLDAHLETAKKNAEKWDSEAEEQEEAERDLLEQARKKREAAKTNRQLATTKRNHISNVLGQ